MRNHTRRPRSGVQAIFDGKARCATCHLPPLFTEPGWSMHSAAEIGIDDFQSRRSPDNMYRTTPLAGLFVREKGGFYQDGRFADYMAVVNHYDGHFRLGLTPAEESLRAWGGSGAARCSLGSSWSFLRLRSSPLRMPGRRRGPDGALTLGE